VEGHIRVASSIQEQNTGQFNTTADGTIKFVWIDMIKGLRHLFIIKIKVTVSLETK